MNFVTAAAQVAEFLLEHGDLIGDLVDVISSGASKESIRKAIRDVKVEVSDKAFQEELGLDK